MQDLSAHRDYRDRTIALACNIAAVNSLLWRFLGETARPAGPASPGSTLRFISASGGRHEMIGAGDFSHFGSSRRAGAALYDSVGQ